MIRRFLFACIIALAFTLILNARSLQELSAGQLSVAYLNDHAVDEQFYFSTIAKVGQGAPAFGHSSYFEHHDDVSAVSLAPVTEGLLMRLLHLPLAQTLLLSDLLFPFLAILILTFGLTYVFKKSLLPAGAVAVIVGSDIGTYWFRSSNPQLPFVGAAAWFATTLAMPLQSTTALVLRATIAGTLSWFHLVYASFFIIADGVLLLSGYLEQRSLRQLVKNSLLYLVVLGILIAPRLLMNVPAEVAEDTLARIGVIHTRIPAGPKMQLLILGLMAIMLILHWKRRAWPKEALWKCFLLLIASLLALNQSLIHGRDALFVSYYNGVLRMVMLLSILILFVQITKNALWSRIAVGVCAVVSIVLLWNAVGLVARESRANADRYEESDIPKILAWIGEQPGLLVVAAPSDINARIPYETPHYDLFNAYGWNLPLTDKELAERYALQVNLVPSTKILDRTYTNIFGGYAGLSGSKRRTFCKMKRALLRTSDPCIVEPRSLIRHQELLPMVDDAKIDVVDAMKRYHVSLIVTEEGEQLPLVIKNACSKATTIGMYTTWSCSEL